MDNDLQAQLAARMAELPTDVRAAIMSADFGKKVQAIGAKHQLHIDQIGILEDEVLLVMLAFSEPNEFVSNIVEQLHIGEDVANIIADEISNDILMPIRESMREFMEARAARNVRDTHSESGGVATSTITPFTTRPAFQAADAALAGKTVTLPPAPLTQAGLSSPPPPTQAPISTRDYTTDPYHEPVE